jgi:hypothetical protein
MFKLTIQDATAEGLRQKIIDAQPKGGSPLAVFDSETLLEELRSRFRQQGLVVNVTSFASDGADESGATQTATEPPKATKPRASTKPKADPVQETAKPIAAATATAQAMKETGGAASPPAEATKADVLAALDACATATGGQVIPREIMARVGGAAKLADIPTAKWAELVAALKEKAAAAKAPQTVAA